MSVIQTIRNRYGKIAGAVIAIALVGFIVSDARNGSFGNLFGGHDNNIMKVDGVKIDPKEYQTQLKEFEIVNTMGRTLDDASRAQLNEAFVRIVVEQTVIGELCDKMGIQTTEDEKKELIYGQNADPLIQGFQIQGQQIFINQQTRQFDPQIIKYMEKQFQEDPQKFDPTGKVREQWDAVKSFVLRMNRIYKFKTLVGGSIYPPLYLAKRNITDQNSIASIRYVKVPYTSVADNEVKVTDADINDYLKKHAGLFQTDQPARGIEYVSFDIVPAAADTARALDALAQIRSDFAAVKEKDNKTFVNNKSDETNSFSDAYQNKRTFLSKEADTIMSLPVGEIYGPYYENGSYKLTKVLDRKTLPDSAKIRHILVRTKDHDHEIMSDSMAKLKIDSAIAAINAGAKFDSMVTIYSEDDGSKQKGGEYTFTLQQRPTISKEFGDFAFEGKPGEKKLVKVSNDNYSGYHYIEILEQHGVAPSVQLATISKNLAPSDSTVNAIYGKANEFAGKNATAAEFDAAIAKQKFDKRIGDNVKETNFTVTGLGPAREVIKWMFEHKIGDVSPVFQLGDQRYVVAKLSSVQDKGEMGITATNRPQLEQKVREEMKADLIVKKFAGSASLEAVAGKANAQVEQSDSVVLGGAYIPNLGYEPKVVGYAFCPTFQPNTVSAGIKGQAGVYFISVTNRTAKPLDQSMMQILGQERGMEEGQMRNAIGQLLQQALTKQADVKYNVANF
jgi:peptidyl-prolyl cis-trans isomerase D